MTVVIQTSGLTRRFGDKLAVDNLELSLSKGEVFGFLGHNGAGKTTTIRLLNGVLKPSSGKAMVLGHNTETEGAEMRRKTGVLTETPALDARLSAKENLEIYAQLFGVPRVEAGKRVREVLEQFHLSERTHDRVGGFSKGMKQRLALARTLLHQPELLFLDEPTAGLDPLAAREVHELIAGLKAQGRTVFLTTHNLNEAQVLCDRVGVMEKGKLKALGTPAELARRVAGLRVVLEVGPGEQGKALEVLRRMGLEGIRQKAGSKVASGVRVGSELRVGSEVGDEVGGELRDEVKGEGGDGEVLEVSPINRSQVPELVRGLVEAGVRVYRVELVSPSLEDIYFALYGGGR